MAAPSKGWSTAGGSHGVRSIPRFDSLTLQQDAGGRWHLEARFSHWRQSAARQYERSFSDGTLRLIGLLWSLAEGGGPLLLEEPELALHDALVRHLPALPELRSRLLGTPRTEGMESRVAVRDVERPGCLDMIDPGARKARQ